MDTPLLVLQIMLSLLFLFTGLGKCIYDQQSLEKKGFKGLDEYSAGFINFIGIAEVLGALGLVLPLLLDTLSPLIAYSAAGLGAIMVGASIHNFRKHEYQAAVTTLVILLLCVFIAYFRWI